MLAESDTEIANGTEGKDAPCVLPEGEMSVYTAGMMPTTPPNPLFPDTSLSLTLCSRSLCVQEDLCGEPQNPCTKVEREKGVLMKREKGEEE